MPKVKQGCGIGSFGKGEAAVQEGMQEPGLSKFQTATFACKLSINFMNDTCNL